MTIQSAYTTSYLSRTFNVGGTTSSSAAAAGFAEQAQSRTGSAAQSAGPPPRMSESDLDAAKSKLKEIDSSLADKMEKFHAEIENLEDSGASQKTIQATMKENMDSLSDTEKSELEQVFGRMPGSSGETSESKDPLDELISSLSSSNPDLAEKLQTLQDKVTEMRESGETEEAVQQTIKDTFDSLSEDEQSGIKSAISQQRGPHGPPPGPPPGGPPPTSESSETEEDSLTELIEALQTSNSSLSEKLQGFEDQITELKESGADEDTVQSAIASNLASLSETEKTDLLNAIFSQRESNSANSSNQTSYAQAQAASVYGASGYLPYDPILAYSA